MQQRPKSARHLRACIYIAVVLPCVEPLNRQHSNRKPHLQALQYPVYSVFNRLADAELRGGEHGPGR